MKKAMGGDGFGEDNNNSFCALSKGYFYPKRKLKCGWIQCIKCKKLLHEDCNGDHL